MRSKRYKTTFSQSSFIRWICQRTDPKHYGASRKKAALVFGPSKSGKKSTIHMILEQKNMEVITISDQGKMKHPHTFSNGGILGLHAYIIDIDNMQGFPSLPSAITDDSSFRAPIIYVCTNPFRKKGHKRWIDIQREFVVIQSDKDSAFIQNRIFQQTATKNMDLFLDGTPPWTLINNIVSSQRDLQTKMQAAGTDPDKILSITRGNIDKAICNENLQEIVHFNDILCCSDLMTKKQKEAFVFGDLDDYRLCSLIHCISTLGITRNTKLSYKMKYEPRHEKRSSALYDQSRYKVLNKRGEKRKVE